MTRQDLIKCIRKHEKYCMALGTSFWIKDALELASGIIAILDTDKVYAVYFDKTRYGIRSKAVIEDIGPEIFDFPSNAGFFHHKKSQNWEEIAQISEKSLKGLNRRKIVWHEKPIRVEYVRT